MTINHSHLEDLARSICEAHRGPGRYDMPRTHRQHWRDLAAAQIERERGRSILDALLGIFGFKRVSK
jgi:hypothetical protein